MKKKNFNKKFLALFLCISFILIVVFFVGPSFSNFMNNEIPSCSCVNEGKTIIEHTDECAMKTYYRDLSKNNSAEDLVNKWDSFSDEEKTAMKEFLSMDDPIKKIEFDGLINKQKISLVTTNVNDGTQVLVQGDIPKGAVVDVVLTDKEKVSVIEDGTVGIVESNVKPERAFTYDISLEKNSKDISSDVDEAVITIANIGATKDKVYKVYHLLDEADVINSGISSDSVRKVISSNFDDLFSKEVAAANEVSGDNNSIYVKSFEATVNNDGSISFSTESFSTFYVVEYTVDFHYNGLIYNMPGDSSMLLSQLFTELQINKNVSDVISVEFSDDTLLKITHLDNGDWQLTSLGAFKTVEKLTIIFSDKVIIELEVTDSALQTTNNDVKIGTEGVYTIYQIFGTLYPEIDALYSRMVGSRNNKFILQNTDGTQVAIASVSHVGQGTNFTFVSDTWWFTASSSMDISESDTSINHFKYNVSTLSTMKDITVKKYPRVTYNNPNICVVKQRSVFSANTASRVVYIYVNNALISNASYQFPTRGGVDSSYIDVTSYDVSKYQMTKSVVDSSNYRVDLNAIANLSYNANGGIGAPTSQTVVYGVPITLSTTIPTRTGYTFKGWSETSGGSAKYSAGGSFTSNITNPGDVKTLYAVWEGNTVNYTVNHYKQSLDGGYPTSPSGTNTISGKVGDMTTASPNTYEGFTANSFSQVSIGVSGATVNIYYTRNSYPYTIYHKDKDLGTTLTSETTGNALYGASLNISNYQKSIDKYTYNSSTPATLTVGVSNNTATIYYLKKTAKYTVNYYLQNIDDDNYILYSTETNTGYVGDEATWSQKTIVGAELDQNRYPKAFNIAENGSTVVDVYYNRKVYKVSYNYTGDISPVDASSLPAPASYRYGKVVSVGTSVPTATGYTFSGWNKTGTIEIKDNVIITGSWTPNTNAFYRVNYYKKGTTTTLRESKTVENREYGKSYTESAILIPGYKVDGSSSIAVSAGYSNNEISFYYTPSSDTKYYVYYYKQDLDGNYVLDERVERYGTTDTLASYEELSDEASIGFTIKNDLLNSNYENINGDSANDPTIIKIYYERNKYTFTWKVTKNDDSSYLDTGYKEYYYGATIDKRAPKEDDYTFYGWEINPSSLDEVPSTMPAYNISISGELVRNIRDLVIIKEWPDSETGQAIFLVEGNGLSIEVVIDGNKPTTIKGLPLGEEYTITEIKWPSNYKPADPIKKVIDSNNNNVYVSSEFNNFGWFSGKSLVKNVFGKR